MRRNGTGCTRRAKGSSLRGALLAEVLPERRLLTQLSRPTRGQPQELLSHAAGKPSTRRNLLSVATYIHERDRLTMDKKQHDQMQKYRQQLAVADQIVLTEDESQEREALFREFKRLLQHSWAADVSRLYKPLEHMEDRHGYALEMPGTNIFSLLADLENLTISSRGWMRRFARLHEELRYAIYADIDADSSMLQEVAGVPSAEFMDLELNRESRYQPPQEYPRTVTNVGDLPDVDATGHRA